MKEILQYGVPIICAAIAAAGAWQARENKRLRRKLRTALEDCAAFYAIEELYCEAVSDGTVGAIAFKSALASKRLMRTLLRAKGGRTPSDQATPQRLQVELGKL